MTMTQTEMRAFWYLGNHVTIHADASDTKGQYALLEVISKPGGEPPMHYHENEDELFLVLEGELTVYRGNEELTVRAGESAMIFRGTPHTFRVRSKAARVIGVVTPAGFENFFRELGSSNPEEIPPFEKIAATAARYGSRILS